MARDVQHDAPHQIVKPEKLEFLFAVVRDVQRNTGDDEGPTAPWCFYSLSCETYSATLTLTGPGGATVVSIRCVRDVQRNRAAEPAQAVGEVGFYSLSCETYSATRDVQATGKDT